MFTWPQFDLFQCKVLVLTVVSDCQVLICSWTWVPSKKGIRSFDCTVVGVGAGPLDFFLGFFHVGKARRVGNFKGCAATSAPWMTVRSSKVCSGPGMCNSTKQVWSLTQLYSVDFSQSRISVKNCVFNKHTIKVCVSYCWRCSGTSAPSAAHLSVGVLVSL